MLFKKRYTEDEIKLLKLELSSTLGIKEDIKIYNAVVRMQKKAQLLAEYTQATGQSMIKIDGALGAEVLELQEDGQIRYIKEETIY